MRFLKKIKEIIRRDRIKQQKQQYKTFKLAGHLQRMRENRTTEEVREARVLGKRKVERQRSNK